MSVVALKRTGLVASVKAAMDRTGMAQAVIPPVVLTPEAIVVAETPPAASPAPPLCDRTLTDSNATTAVHISKDQLHLLRLVAVTRANQDGGRPSVSNVLLELIEANRPELEREAAVR